MELAKITSNGQITLPTNIRRALNLRDGDKIAFIEEDGKYKLGLGTEEDVGNCSWLEEQIPMQNNEKLLYPFLNAPLNPCEDTSLKSFIEAGWDDYLIPQYCYLSELLRTALTVSSRADSLKAEIIVSVGQKSKSFDEAIISDYWNPIVDFLKEEFNVSFNKDIETSWLLYIFHSLEKWLLYSRGRFSHRGADFTGINMPQDVFRNELSWIIGHIIRGEKYVRSSSPDDGYVDGYSEKGIEELEDLKYELETKLDELDFDERYNKPLTTNEFYSREYGYDRRILERKIEYIDTRIDELATIDNREHFNLKEDYLYVFDDTVQNCVNQHHLTKKIPLIVETMNCGLQQIIINYCARCNRYFIAKKEYQDVLERYGALSMRIQFIKNDGVYPEDEHPVFNSDNTTLYIYNGWRIVCHIYNHNTVSVNASIPTGNNERREIKVEYCKKCKKFFIGEDEYFYYLKQLGYLPISKMYTDDDGNFPKNDESIPIDADDFATHSVLFKAGYNVNQRNDLTDRERQEILLHIIVKSIASRYSICNYLETFIAQASGRKNMELAISKWKRDLEFIRNLPVDYPGTVVIDKIEKWRHD